MGVVAVATANKDISLTSLHPKTRREIEEFGAKTVLARRVAMARIARRNDSPLALGYRKEAESIALEFGLAIT